jgi:hypothetical protein
MDTIFFEAMYGLEAIGGDMIIPLIGIGIGVIAEGMAGLLVGLAQWLVLQTSIRNAGRWVVISIVAMATNGAVMGGLDMAAGGLDEETMFWFISVGGGIVPGLITATGLVRLLARSGRDSRR